MDITGMIKMAAITVSAVVLSTTSALARDTVIGLSPYQAPEALKAQIERAVMHLAETLEPGETGLFFDAANGQLIGSFEVPDGAAYANVRARINANRAGLQNLKHFMDSAEAVPGRLGALDLPGFLRLVRQAYPAPDGADMIVLGSPIALMPHAPSLSMQGGRVPNDGHVAADISASPFGTDGLPGTLEGYDLYFGVTSTDWGVSPAHAYHVERLWTISAEAHGAYMAYFGGDLNTLFRLAGADALDRTHSQPLDPAAPRTMRVFKPDTGEGTKIDTKTEKGSTSATQTVTANGIEVDDFSLFASQPHPSLSGVKVTTGIRYVPHDYPDRYVNAWCYFFVEHDGSQHRIQLGTKEWGQNIAKADVSTRARRAAGIDPEDVDAGVSACQWPTD